MIAGELDFVSLARLRLTNTTIRAFVDSLKVWTEVQEVAHDTLWALKATTLLPWYPARVIHGLVTNDRCGVCGKHGPFVFLPGLLRVCYTDLMQHPGPCTTMSSSMAKHTFGLSNKHLRQIPTLWTIPDDYTSVAASRPLKRARIQHSSFRLLSMDDVVRQTATQLPPRQSELSKIFGPMRQERIRANNAEQWYAETSIAAPSLDPKTARIERGVWCEHCKDKITNLDADIIFFELVATTDRQTGGRIQSEESEDLTKKLTALRRKIANYSRTSYTRQEFRQHLDECTAWWDFYAATLRVIGRETNFL